jgi:hypothetical protein
MLQKGTKDDEETEGFTQSVSSWPFFDWSSILRPIYHLSQARQGKADSELVMIASHSHIALYNLSMSYFSMPMLKDQYTVDQLSWALALVSLLPPPHNNNQKTLVRTKDLNLLVARTDPRHIELMKNRHKSVKPPLRALIKNTLTTY